MLRKLFLLCMLLPVIFSLTHAQAPTYNYEKAYKKIDSLLEKEGLTASALKEVNLLYNKAKAANNEPQLIKALIYRLNITEIKEENAVLKNIASLKKEISSSREPARSILLNIEAGLYDRYLQMNRWKLYSRTESSSNQKNDPATWSIGKLLDTISVLYQASISKQAILQKTAVDRFDPIIIKGNVRNLRPTLYDLLAQRALGFFSRDESAMVRAANAFTIDDSAAFAPAIDFVKHAWITNDKSSLLLLAIQTYQRLAAFHLQDADPQALLDLDLDRIQFVYQHSVMPQKEELYINALQNIRRKYDNQPSASQASYLLAQWYANQAAQYQAGSELHRYDYLKAIALCNDALQQKDSSEGKVRCSMLLNQIKQPSMDVTLEKVNLPHQPFRALVTYKNSERLYYRIIKTDRNQKEKLLAAGSGDDYWGGLAGLPYAYKRMQVLPLASDYQSHRVEMSVDALSPGEYFLLTSRNENFTLTDNILTVSNFYVSGISYINDEENYWVLDRNSGRPLSRAEVQVWYRYYDEGQRRYRLRQGEHLFSDQLGRFSITAGSSKQAYNFQLDIKHAGDELFLDDYSYRYFTKNSLEEKEKTVAQTFFFTDRSIYRPGQLLYFKGIMIERVPGEARGQLLPQVQDTIILYNANNQPIDSIALVSNDYGSFNGQFRLPVNALKGQFRLQDRHSQSSVWFHVEAYKRPGFRVEINTPSKPYKLSDSITVDAKALAYSGQMIAGATVHYRVVRRTQFPIWSAYARIWPPYRTASTEITHGEAVTGKDGSFSIQFAALPDEKISRASDPVFHFEISAEVTNINGETRSGTVVLSAAYHALQLSFQMPEKMPADSFKQIAISAVDLNDKPQKADLQFHIFALQSPNNIYRERRWPAPDTFLLGREEYRKLFPHDIYMSEDMPSNWPIMHEAKSWKDSARGETQIVFPGTALAPGWYKIQAVFTEKDGTEQKAEQLIQLTGDEPLAGHVTGSLQIDNRPYQPGDWAGYRFESNLDSVWLIQQINRSGRDSTALLSLDRSNRNKKLEIKSDDRGGIGIDIAFVKYNSVFTDHKVIPVPFQDKELKISYNSFRDQTIPGSRETWSVKISGPQATPVAAEMLTAMYDASLDQFQKHQWSLPDLWQIQARAVAWSTDNGFNVAETRNGIYLVIPAIDFTKEYDRLLFPFQNGPGRTYRYTMSEAKNTGIIMADSAVPAAMKNEESGVPGGDATAPATREEPAPEITARRNFNETAFFFPDLHTDSSGNISFTFTMPEAITEWKWMSLAHTRDLALGYSEKTITTRKQLMVLANPPRFIREGDRMDFAATIVNLSDSEITGQVQLLLIDPKTNESVDGWFQNFFPNQYFTVEPGQSVPARFSIEIPYKYNRPLIYRVVARSGNMSDGEEAILPVLSNKELITETLPLNMTGNGSKHFTFNPLLKSGESETLSQHALTIEYSSNPAWYAVQALPYLNQIQYDCAEQFFNQFYSNALAAAIVAQSPAIRKIVQQWYHSDSSGFASRLEQNQELKTVLLQETPWVLEAQNETEQLQRIAHLLSDDSVQIRLQASLEQLKDMQLDNGGFAWFKGGPDDRFITQYIVAGLGHLRQLGALTDKNALLQGMLSRAIAYADQRLQEDYTAVINSKAPLQEQHPGPLQIQYLYLRSLFNDMPVAGSAFKAYHYYRDQARKYWMEESKQVQGMIALALFRTGEKMTATKIMKSLQQNAIRDNNNGMYWKEWNTSGYYWHQSPIAAQAIMIEAFDEIVGNPSITASLKVWLLEQKQTQYWQGSRATADACYALLLRGGNWLQAAPSVKISLGSQDKGIRLLTDKGAAAGTGYFKETIEGSFVRPDLGHINVELNNAPKDAAPGWGAVYWQYFEQPEKIKEAGNGIFISRQLFVQRDTDKGPVLDAIKENEVLHPGDKVKARIILKTNKNLEYVHLKDRRASCMEPLNVLSGYRYQGGLGYYESTGDAVTDFFFPQLPTGTWVFEYEMSVQQTGHFSSGSSLVQCLYAPSFTAHSTGVLLTVEN